LKLFVASLEPGGIFGLTISVKKIIQLVTAIIKFFYVLKRNKKLGMQICNITLQTAMCWSVSTQGAVPSSSASSHSYNLKKILQSRTEFYFKNAS
jgi:hypothetical protein